MLEFIYSCNQGKGGCLDLNITLKYFQGHLKSRGVLAVAIVAGLCGLQGLAGAGTASAASSASRYVCGTQGSGFAGNVPGKQWQKKPPGCHDLNLVGARASVGTGFDYYTGYYLSGNRWIRAASGAHKVFDGSNFDVVLITNVATGTWLSVTGTHEAPDSVTVNY